MIRTVSAALVGLAVATGCGDGSASRDKVIVSAASSLSTVMTAIEAEFEAARVDVDIVLNLAGTSSLRAQILEGAPVDVFVAADRPEMVVVREAGLTVGDPAVFALNRLAIAVPSGNPGGVEGLESFADENLIAGLCAPHVPCGALARRMLAAAGVTAGPDTEEPDVRSLLTKIEAGELDAGIVYASDLEAGDVAVEGVSIHSELNVEVAYPVAIIASGSQRELAQEFKAFLLSDAGRNIVAENGFDLP